jgi:hypothetical protein
VTVHTIGAIGTTFDIDIDGRPASLAQLMPGIGDDDRLGLVVTSALGGLGSSALVLALVIDFYATHDDQVRALRPGELLYPQHFVFHVERAWGQYSWLDFWPPDKEMVVGTAPADLARALIDRGITRLLIEDATGACTPAAIGRSERDQLQRQLATCLAYSPTGRVRAADVSITSNPTAERWVEWTIDPERAVTESGRPGAASVAGSPSTARVGDALRVQARRRRAELLQDARPVETYRRLSTSEAIDLLTTR